MPKRKVLLLNHSAAIGGASLSLLVVVRELRAAGCDAYVLTPPGPIEADLRDIGATPVPWNPPAVYWFGVPTYSSGTFGFSVGYLLALLLLPLRLLRAQQLIHALVTEFAIDTIHVNTVVLFPLGPVLRKLEKKHGVRVLWHIREMISERLHPAMRSFMIHSIDSASSAIIAISESVAVHFPGNSKITVIHNELTETVFGRTGVSPPAKPVVCMVTAFLEGKGIPDFFKVARQLLPRHQDVEFVLYTTRPALTGRMDRLAWKVFSRFSPSARWALPTLWAVNECAFDNRIKVRFDVRMTPELYSKCSIYVNTDEMGVTWGRVVMEAMCAGLPVVATGSSEEFIVNGTTGFLVPPGRPELVADYVERLLLDYDLCETMGNNGLKRAQELFSTEMFRKKLLNVFQLDDTVHSASGVV